MQAGGSEGDKIILLAFQQIGCPITEDIEAISDIVSRPELLVDLVVRAIWLITEGQAKFPVELPAGVAARHRISTLIASKVKDLGYSGDCGYNQLLYPNETSTRQLLVWLVEKLPRTEEDDGAVEEPLGPHALLNRRVKAALGIWSQSPYCWPGFLNLSSKEEKEQGEEVRIWPFRTFPLRLKKKDGSSFPDPPLVTAQVPHLQYFPPSVFEVNSQKLAWAQFREEQELGLIALSTDVQKKNRGQLIKDAFTQAALRRRLNNSAGGGGHGQGLADLMALLEDEEAAARKSNFQTSRFAHAVEFGQEHQVEGDALKLPQMPEMEEAHGEALSAEEIKERARRETEAVQRGREEELAVMQRRLDELLNRLALLHKERDLEETALRQLEGELAALGEEAEGLEKEYLVKRKTLEMLPNAAEHMMKLQEICAASAKKLMDLGQEWERHRRPLIDAIGKAKEEKQRRKERCQDMVEEIQRCRHEMQTMTQEMRDKEERAKFLEEEYKRMNRSINRNMYTHRILDIIASIAKQKQGIDRIISDIRDVQKEINTASATLSRTDLITDEKIFKAANKHQKDAGLVASYRQLTDLRQRFERVLNVVREIGQRETECRDIESKIRLLSSRLSSNDIYERIQHDLEGIRKENSQLLSQLDSLMNA